MIDAFTVAGSEAVAASTRRLIAIGAFIAPLAAAADAPSGPQDAIELHVASDGDELAFRPAHLSCRTGAHVRLFFDHTGEIINDAHDWVLLKSGVVVARV